MQKYERWRELLHESPTPKIWWEMGQKETTEIEFGSVSLFRSRRKFCSSEKAAASEEGSFRKV